MSNKAFIYIFLWHSCFIANGQSFFNIIPELESIEGQGSCRVVSPDFTGFFTYGIKYDTSYGGSSTKPWISWFAYDGQMETHCNLIDTTFEDSFNASFFSFSKGINDVWYGYSGRNLSGTLVPYIFQFNSHSGEIFNSMIVPNENYLTESRTPVKIINSNNTISLLSYLIKDDSTRIFITVLDTSFNLLRELKIQSTSRRQFPKNIIQRGDGSYLLVLDSYRNKSDEFNDYITSYMEINAEGTLEAFKWSPTHIPLSNLLLQAKNVISNERKEWIITSHHLVYYPDSCLNCAVQIPYIFSVSENFDSLLWETRFFDIPYIVGPYYHVYSLTQVKDGYIGAGDLRKNLNGHHISGTLFKAGLNGDSLWMKHYVPLNWENSRVRVARLYDIKTTPEGTIIAAGEVYDDSLKGLFPWILHLDSDGCLVPGCNIVSSVTVPSETSWTESKFVMYPNPVSEMLYILSRVTSAEPYLISLVKPDGTVSRSTQFLASEGSQYTLPLENLPGGSYFILISDPKTGFVETHNIVKL